MKIQEVSEYMDALGSEHVDPDRMGSGDGAKAIADSMDMTQKDQEELWDICRDEVRNELRDAPPAFRALCSMYMHVGFLMGTKWQMERGDG